MAILDEAKNVELKATNKLRGGKSTPWRYLSGLVLVACFMLLAVPVVSNIVRFNIPAWALLAAFMEKTAQKDYESAYALYSPQAKEKMSLSDFEAMSHDNNFVSFEDYKGLIFRDFHLQAAYVPELPEFMADIEGTMFYGGKSSRPFTATLVMIDNRWMIESIQIDSSPSQP